MLLILLLGCGPGEPTPIAPPTLDLAADGAVIDPKLDGEPTLTFTVAPGAPCALEVTITNPVGQLATLLADGELAAGATLPWDGHDDAGMPFDPGPALLAAHAACDDGTETWTGVDLRVVRLGFVAIDLVDSGDGGNVELAFHKLDLVTPGITRLDDSWPEWHLGGDGASALDAADGTPLPAPDPWTDPDRPPWGPGEEGAYLSWSLPAAYVAGHRPAVNLVLGGTGVSAARGMAVDAGLDGLELRPVADGWTFGDGHLEPGALYLGIGPERPTTMGRETVSWRWRFTWRDGDTYRDIPGWVDTTHEIYQLAGPPALRDGSEVGAAPAVPWVGVLDETAERLQGVEADPVAVLDALHGYLHEADWLVYDPGDSSYSSYQGEYIYWESITSDLSSWLDRREGTHLYCHSVSCLLSTIAGHHGVRAEQQVLGVGFSTWYVLAAGTDTWSTWSFNSHSLVSPDGGETLWDAAIDLDGDGDPSTLPATAVPARGLAFDDYMAMFSPDAPEIVNQGLCYFR